MVYIWMLYVVYLFKVCCSAEISTRNDQRLTAGRESHAHSPGRLPNSTTVSVVEHNKREFSKISIHSTECTKRKQGRLRYDVTKRTLLLCYHNQWQEIGMTRVKSTEKAKRPISCLDAKFKGLAEGKGDGLYWINPSGVDDLRNAFLVYCDMTTAGGGWTLVAKITHDYAWICPEHKGSNCLNSRVDPLKANLFHTVHARDFVDLSITADENSGIHLKNKIIRKMFKDGRQSVRFTFVTSRKGWSPSEDAYAAFNSEKTNKMFLEKSWANYSRDNDDYTWNVIQHQRKHLKFTGTIMCWGDRVNDYRFYDQGLHAGSPAGGPKRCHMAYDETEVMLKSHYARIDNTGRKARWDLAQFGFLGSKVLQAPCQRIALWVR